ncbi:uncharacterized protein LOC108035959 isoform X2 [Drosophila biarmipes]|uniref:uncharacterized protein LOC108035959 isoform X2 n=1 Tax=Drosophila biarmipes TaxID=125945 RepID=UPI0007E6EB70|nr:uncharacterized protein LOC108035959 isoform X2 [Drosophila biarmipes]
MHSCFCNMDKTMERYGDSSMEMKYPKCQALAKVSSVPGRVSPRTGKTACKGMCCNSNSLTSQGSQRKKSGELTSAVNFNSSACSTMKLYQTRISQNNKTPPEANKKNKRGPKPKPELKQGQRALVKAKPKRIKTIGRKFTARSTAGHIEQPPDDDDGIWFECNVPFRVNIPFPISMKNLFGPQLFSGNTNLEIFKTLVPTRKCQGDRRTECPLNFSMRPALPPPDLEVNTTCPKATKFSRKKCRRGRKHCPCEISTQTTDEESDPVLCCLEQIRNQLADNSSEKQEKSIYRCFAEKSTSARSIPKHTNKTDMEKIKESPSKETPQEQNDKNGMHMSHPESVQKILPTTLAQSNPKIEKLESEKCLSKNPSKTDSVPSTSSIKSSKKVHVKNKPISESNEKDVEEPREPEKEKDLNSYRKTVPKSAFCFCRLSQVLHKCTRIMIPCSVCQCHCLNRSHMSRRPYPRDPQQQQQRNASQLPSTTTFKREEVDIKSNAINTIQEIALPKINNQKDLNPKSSHFEDQIPHVGTDDQKNIIKRVPEPSNQISQDNKCNKDSKPKDGYPEYHDDDESLSREKIKPQHKAQRNTPSDRENYPEVSSKHLGPKNSFKKRNTDISTNESNLSFKISHRSPKNINSKYSSKSEKSLDGAKSKKQTSQRNPTRDKKNKHTNNRISSGGETIPEESTNFGKGCKNNQVCEIESDYDIGSNTSTNSGRQEIVKEPEEKIVNNPYRRNKKDFADMNKNSKYLESEQENFKESLSVDQEINEVRECSDQIYRKSDETNTLGNYSNNREYNSYCEVGERSEECVPKTSESEFKHQINHFPYRCYFKNREYFRQRSQSAPECWILQCSQRNQTPQSPTFTPRKENCQEYATYPENVLVLQDESCESESNECVLVLDDNETANSKCCACKTPDYSINADILKQLREQERLFNQIQDITFVPTDHQGPVGFATSPQEQERDNTPLVTVPYRNISRPNEWRDQGGNFAKLKRNQFRVAPISQVPPQNSENAKKMKLTRETNSNTSFSQLEVNYPSTSSSFRPNTHLQDRRSTKGYRKNMVKKRNNFPKSSCAQSRKCQHQTFHTISQGSAVSASHHSPLSQSNTSIESRDRPKTPENASYTRLRPQINSNDPSNSIRRTLSNRQPKDSQASHFEDKNKKPRNDDYGQNGFRYERNNEDSFGTTGRSEYYATRSNPPGLTWTEPYGSASSVMPLDAPALSKCIIRSNGTVRSTDVETLQTVTLMEPRKLRDTESARIRSQATGLENTVLIETRTPCNRENLLQTCGRPPCIFRTQQYTGIPPSLHQGFVISKPPAHTIQPQTSMSAPQYRTPFNDNCLIEPRDQWSTVRSPASAPVMNSRFQQHQHPTNFHQPTNGTYHHFLEQVHPPAVGSNGFNNPGYYSQNLKENIKMLPEGFYERTVNKYNITRMDSNFQPPHLMPEFLQEQQQPFFRHTASPHTNQFHQQRVVGTAQDLYRPFIPPQTPYNEELQSHPSLFCPHQSVKLDDYDQSEYQI